MKILLKIRPFVFLVGFAGLLPILIIIFKIWANFIPATLRPYGFSIFLVGFISYYFLWIYVIGYGFNELDKKTDNDLGINKFGILIIITFLSVLFINLMNFYLLIIQSNQTLIYLNIPFTLISMYCFIQIIIQLTKHFRLYDEKEEPRIIDYIVTMFLLSFFPFGLIIMHAHLRLFLKEKLLIK
jgi:hypothetical protein